MPRGFRVKWTGPVVVARTLEATRKGVDKTMAQCIAPAKRLTPVVTGTAQGSIQIQDFAKRSRNKTSGTWGSQKVDYFIWLEVGKAGRTGHHMLRRSADENYPNLAGNIKGFM